MTRAQVVNCAARLAGTEAEGPGLRFALWVQGCPLRCAGCCNPEMIPFRRAEPVTVARLLAELDAAPDLDGVTLLGGEPFAQPGPLAVFAEGARARGLSVVTFTGYRREELRALPGRAPARLLAATDLLVDGRYDHAAGRSPHPGVGSANQRLLARTARGEALAARWDLGPRVVEVRLDPAGAVRWSGEPGEAPGAV